MLWLLLVSSFFFFIGLFSVFLFSIYTKLKNDNRQLQESLNKAAGAAGLVVSDREVKDDRTQLAKSPKSLIEEILPSKSPKWEELLELCKQSVENGSGREGNGSVQERDGNGDGDGDGDGDGESGGEDMRVVKKKKKRAKKKRLDVKSEEDVESKKEMDSDPGRLKPELVCMYPFTSTGSATQRKIKQQYDQLVKCHESKGLTLVQVGEFANCLVDAKHELQQKSEVIKRKFTIAKALLSKADRSSFDRLRQQIYKLETEQKRLEDDAFVYNWLQQQLKLSPAYKKMLELSVSMELEAKSNELMQSTDTDESADISFEELLAQEKKDSFWQKAGKSRLCST